MERSIKERLDLSGRVAVITGGAGLLGVKHGEAIAEMGGIPVLLDVDGPRAEAAAAGLAAQYGVDTVGLAADIRDRASVESVRAQLEERFGGVHILVNNAARNPKVEGQEPGARHWSRLEEFPLDQWDLDISVGLTGALVCSQVFGSEMAARGEGVILNIASDLGVIAPDQRIYRQPGLPSEEQPVKPVTYSVVKHGLIGLTRYLATYWAERGVRVNALVPGGVSAGQDDAFVARLTNLIPLGRMAQGDEYKAAVAFLVSDASSYMTGASLVIDGGRTVW
jgi:NAD(P)-dependent dehydrogenase (short-subunit alcohol dehydrogenase family)